MLSHGASGQNLIKTFNLFIHLLLFITNDGYTATTITTVTAVTVKGTITALTAISLDSFPPFASTNTPTDSCITALSYFCFLCCL